MKVLNPWLRFIWLVIILNARERDDERTMSCFRQIDIMPLLAFAIRRVGSQEKQRCFICRVCNRNKHGYVQTQPGTLSYRLCGGEENLWFPKFKFGSLKLCGTYLAGSSSKCQTRNRPWMKGKYRISSKKRWKQKLFGVDAIQKLSLCIRKSLWWTEIASGRQLTWTRGAGRILDGPRMT